jgi:biotin carboxyl carrier protein
VNNLPRIEETLYSPCSGTVEKVLTEKDSHVYEWEKLFLIKAHNGKIEEISVGISGHITSLNVKDGQKVDAETALAVIKDDLIITGSD